MTSDALKAMLEIHGNRYGDEDPDMPEHLDGRTVVDLAETLHGLTELVAAGRKAQKLVKAAIADRLGEGGALRYGDTLYRYRHGFTWKVFDSDGFFEWAAGQPAEALSDMFNPSYTKKTGVKKHGGLDSFYEKDWDEDASLTALPMAKAPKWAQTMQEGDQR